jgi:cobalt-zinc-cadmium efflux system membrane fusion protein
MKTPILVVATFFIVVLGAAACGGKVQVAHVDKTPDRPPGEVWLTPSQVSDAKIQVALIESRDVDDTILTSGTVTLDDKLTGHVFSPVTGRVVNIAAQLGQRVKKGDVLATIESPDVGNAVADARKAEADLIAAEHQLKRKKELFEQKAGSAADLEVAQDAYRRAKAEVERAHQKEALLRVGGGNGVSQIYGLPAPLEGEILLRNINPGAEVQGQYSGGATQELFTIGELDRVWVLGDVYEMDFARVHLGVPADVSVVAYPDHVFHGKVDWVSGSLDPGTRTAKVRCTFDNVDRMLRPMMYATVQLSVDQKKSVAIPRNSLMRLGDAKVVFVETGEDSSLVKFRRVAVDVDEGESSPWLEVKHGLDAGQKIVTNGAILLAANLD